MSIKAELERILTPQLLLEVYGLVIPWPKAPKLDWENVGSNLWKKSPELERRIYALLFQRVWQPVSRMPLEQLVAINWLDFLPRPDSANFPEHCLGLIYIFDQTRGRLRDEDVRYTNGFFDDVAFKIVKDTLDHQAEAYHAPQYKEAWISRGYTFDDWVARVVWLFAPLVHSETYMTENRAEIKNLLNNIRREVEQHTGVEDPYASVEQDDERDLLLFRRLMKNKAPNAEELGRDVQIHDYAFWVIRVMTSHFAITDRFGRYPYRNDALGRDFAEGELEWVGETFGRLDPAVRDRIRKDVDAGTWSPLKRTPALEQPDD